MTRLIQIKNGDVRRVALVDEPNVRLLDGCSSVYELAQIAIDSDMNLSEAVQQCAKQEPIGYDLIYTGSSEWRLLPAIDFPGEPARCHISGTGLTHLGSARNRQSMHATAAENLTDSMKMFRSGVEGGRPETGRVGIPPEWFHKGNGGALRGHGEPLDIPSFADDGGEEAEIAGVYIVGRDGLPYRIGMAAGNEFSDHEFETKNYLNLAGSKLRTCALGPELVIDPEFDSVPVVATIIREGAVLWTKTFRTGESEMCHSLRNIEHHHFKFDIHRRPGDVHVHFFGTDCLSFSDQVRLQDGDLMQVAATGFGRPLINTVRVDDSQTTLIQVIPLE
ncbi:MAG: AraD1 family protein [Candidatus Acidiferrum sp.]